jgi:hypothetical protein
MLNNNTFLVVDDEPVSNETILQYLSTTGKIRDVLSVVLRQHAIAKALLDFEISPTEEIVQEQLNQLYEKKNIRNGQQLEEFLDKQKISFSELQRQLATNWAMDQLIQCMSEPSLQDYFINKKSKLDKIRLASIEVDEQGLAEELFDQLTEEKASFEELAKGYSLADSRRDGGQLKSIYRGNLPEALQLALGNTKPGELIGPLAIGERWYVCRLEEVIEASLEGDLETELRLAIFEERLVKEIAQMEVKFQVTQWQYLQTSTR